MIEDEKQAAEAMKERLQDYRLLKRDIDNQIERLERLEEKAGLPSSPNLSGMPKSQNTVPDRLADIIARIIDLKENIKELQCEQDTERKNLEKLIRRLKNADEKAVIRLRYFDFEEWEDIIMLIFGDEIDFIDKYDAYKQKVFRLHKSGIINMSKINAEKR